MAIEVTVRDLEDPSAEPSTVTIENDYVLITHGTCDKTSVQAYPTTKTHVVTIKGVGAAGGFR